MMRWTPEQYQDYLKKQKNEKFGKKSKFHSTKVRVDGILFDSQKEANYYLELKLLAQTGEIKGFCRQGRFIVVAGDDTTAVSEYVTDFIIFNNDGTYEIVDTKGVETDVFKLKMKMMHEKYPNLRINIVK